MSSCAPAKAQGGKGGNDGRLEECVSCKEDKKKSEYSINQWKKASNRGGGRGRRSSGSGGTVTCKACTAEANAAGSTAMHGSNGATAARRETITIFGPGRLLQGPLRPALPPRITCVALQWATAYVQPIVDLPTWQAQFFARAPPRAVAAGWFSAVSASTAAASTAALATSATTGSAKTHRVLVVGGGMSGALTAHLLKRDAAAACDGAAPLHVTVWEMARGAGGRMSTTRWGSPTETRANTGAQYLSAARGGPRGDLAKKLVGDAMRAGLLEGPLAAKQVARHSRCFSEKRGGGESSMDEGGGQEGKDDFRATRGTSAVVKHFVGAADAVQFETRLQSLQHTRGGGGWLATPNSKGKASVGRVADSSQPGWKGGTRNNPEEFDAVVLAMPPKDAARVSGDAKRVLRGVQQQTKHVQWHARFSVALWFMPRDAAAAQAFVAAASRAHQAAPGRAGILDAVVVQAMPEDMTANTHAKQTTRTKLTGSVSVVIQSTADFWARHANVHAGGGRGGGKQAGGGASAGRPEQVTGKGRGAVQAAMLAALQALSPRLVMPKPAHVKMLNWRTSQVKVPARLAAGDGACVVASREPILVLAGDWCTESSFEGCANSAQAAADAVRAALGWRGGTVDTAVAAAAPAASEEKREDVSNEGSGAESKRAAVDVAAAAAAAAVASTDLAERQRELLAFVARYRRGRVFLADHSYVAGVLKAAMRVLGAEAPDVEVNGDLLTAAFDTSGVRVEEEEEEGGAGARTHSGGGGGGGGQGGRGMVGVTVYGACFWYDLGSPPASFWGFVTFSYLAPLIAAPRRF